VEQEYSEPDQTQIEYAPTQLVWPETQPVDNEEVDEDPPPAHWPHAENERLRNTLAQITAQIQALIAENGGLKQMIHNQMQALIAENEVLKQQVKEKEKQLKEVLEIHKKRQRAGCGPETQPEY
jgi:hypothetical protein